MTPKCKRCGRALRSPESVAKGIGPECEGKHGRGKASASQTVSSVSLMTHVDDMDFHPIANVFPMLPQAELETLAADIKANGLHHAITMLDGKVLDGRNRYVACELAGVAPRFEDFTGGDPLAFVISENIARRHLDESQRAMCAARLANMEEGRPGKTTPIGVVSQPASAELLNVSCRSVQRANTVIENGVPELVAAVDAGDIAVSRAADIAREPEDVQREIISRPHVANNTGDNEWYTPPEYIEAARQVLGTIDLDPASSEAANKIVKAKLFYSVDDDGLEHEWSGNVWMNPPYSSSLIKKFASKLVEHVESQDVTSAIVLVNNATETEWFAEMVSVASAIVFPQARVRFLDVNGNPGAPLQGQAVIYIGDDPSGFVGAFSKFGWFAILENGVTLETQSK